MRYIYEKTTARYIRRICRTCEEQYSLFKLQFKNISDEDFKELEKFTKNNRFRLTNKKKNQLLKYSQKLIKIINQNKEKNVFDCFQMSKKQLSELTQNQKPILEDCILNINEQDSEFNKIFDEKVINIFIKCKAFTKMLEIYDFSIKYTKIMILYFNSELLSFFNIFNEDKKFNLMASTEKLLNEYNNNKKIQKVIKNVAELHLRRNILEHKNNIIDSKYRGAVKGLSNDDEGKYLFTSPHYINNNLSNVCNFIILLGGYFKKINCSNKTFITKYVIRHLKDTNALFYTNILKVIKKA